MALKNPTSIPIRTTGKTSLHDVSAPPATALLDGNKKGSVAKVASIKRKEVDAPNGMCSLRIFTIVKLVPYSPAAINNKKRALHTSLKIPGVLEVAVDEADESLNSFMDEVNACWAYPIDRALVLPKCNGSNDSVKSSFFEFCA